MEGSCAIELEMQADGPVLAGTSLSIVSQLAIHRRRSDFYKADD
jgi:hypothetical protein